MRQENSGETMTVYTFKLGDADRQAIQRTAAELGIKPRTFVRMAVQNALQRPGTVLQGALQTSAGNT